MSKCKVCGYRLGDGVKKCPMCGTVAGSTVTGELSPELDLPKYFCPSCNSQILGEHRYCPSCGIDLKEAAKKAENLKTQKQEFAEEKKCVNCGAVLTPNAKFCPECGAKHESSSVQQASKEPAISKNHKTESKKNQKQGSLTTSGGLVNGKPETPMEAFEYEIEDGKYVLTKLKKGYRNLTEIIVPKIFSVIGNQKTLAEDYDIDDEDDGDKFEVKKGAFEGCKNLKNVIIPDGVTSIADYAFCKCENLISINIPDGVTSIGENAFLCCKNLQNLVIPNSVTYIGPYAFQWCIRLKNINIPESVTAVSEMVFCHCHQLNIINIPNTIETIGCFAFANCYNLKEILIPSSVTSIDDSAFDGCKRLKKLTILNSKVSISHYFGLRGLPGILLGCENLEEIYMGDHLLTQHEIEKAKKIAIKRGCVSTIFAYVLFIFSILFIAALGWFLAG